MAVIRIIPLFPGSPTHIFNQCELECGRTCGYTALEMYENPLSKYVMNIIIRIYMDSDNSSVVPAPSRGGGTSVHLAPLQPGCSDRYSLGNIVCMLWLLLCVHVHVTNAVALFMLCTCLIEGREICFVAKDALTRHYRIILN